MQTPSSPWYWSEIIHYLIWYNLSNRKKVGCRKYWYSGLHPISWGNFHTRNFFFKITNWFRKYSYLKKVLYFFLEYMFPNQLCAAPIILSSPLGYFCVPNLLRIKIIFLYFFWEKYFWPKFIFRIRNRIE